MIAIDTGLAPTVIAAAVAFVATVIGVTVPAVWFTAYAVTPLGVIATEYGPVPTVIVVPAAFVAVVIGVTVLAPEFATNAVTPFGVTATPRGAEPTVIAEPAVPLVTLTGVTVPAAELLTYAYCEPPAANAGAAVMVSAMSNPSRDSGTLASAIARRPTVTFRRFTPSQRESAAAGSSPRPPAPKRT